MQLIQSSNIGLCIIGLIQYYLAIGLAAGGSCFRYFFFFVSFRIHYQRIVLLSVFSVSSMILSINGCIVCLIIFRSIFVCIIFISIILIRIIINYSIALAVVRFGYFALVFCLIIRRILVFSVVRSHSICLIVLNSAVSFFSIRSHHSIFISIAAVAAVFCICIAINSFAIMLITGICVISLIGFICGINFIFLTFISRYLVALLTSRITIDCSCKNMSIMTVQSRCRYQRVPLIGTAVRRAAVRRPAVRRSTTRCSTIRSPAIRRPTIGSSAIRCRPTIRRPTLRIPRFGLSAVFGLVRITILYAAVRSGMVFRLLNLLFFSCICIRMIGIFPICVCIRVLNRSVICSVSITYISIRILNITACRAFSVNRSACICIRVLYIAVCGTIAVSRFAHICISVRVLNGSVTCSVFAAGIAVGILHFAASSAISSSASGSVSVAFTANRCCRCFRIQ